MQDSELKSTHEIRTLSEAARAHLSHIIRNGLQGIAGAIEFKDLETAKDEISETSEKLSRLGL